MKEEKRETGEGERKGRGKGKGHMVIENCVPF